MSNDSLYSAMLDACNKSLGNAFEQMVFQPVKVGDAIEKTDGLPVGCISGTIGLTGSFDSTEIRAQLSLIFPEEVAKLIFRSMMMMEPDDPVEMAELRDVVGELTNMSAGGAKTELSSKGFKLSLSLPTVAVGRDHYLGAPSGIRYSKVVPVALNDGHFHFELSVS